MGLGVLEAREKAIIVPGEKTSQHLGVDILANELEVATDVPELLSDLEVPGLTFLTLDVHVDLFVAIVVNYALVVD